MSDYNEFDTERAILEKRDLELKNAQSNEERESLLEQYRLEDERVRQLEEDTSRSEKWLNETVDLLDEGKKTTKPQPMVNPKGAPLDNEPIPKTYGSGAPSYGFIMNKDPNWDAKVEANRQLKENRRNAILAGQAAANAKRDELLGSGKYYDDGQGNIRLKKKYAVSYRGGRRIYDDGAEAARYEMQQAGQRGYDAVYDGRDFATALRQQQYEKAQRGKAKTNEIVELNKAEMEEREKQKEEREIRFAKQNLAVYDGLVVAFKSLSDDSKEAQQTLRDSPYDFKTTLKDKNGRDIGVGGEKKKLAYATEDGYRMQNITDVNGKVIGKRKFGIVGIKAIDAINKKLAEQGNKQYKITAIVAQQRFDAIGNKSGKPVFYVQKHFADGTDHADTLTMKQVYELGLNGYKTTGVNEKDAEDNVIYSLGDIMGTLKRREKIAMRDPKYRESVAKAKLAEWKANNPTSADSISPERLALEIAKLEQRKAEEEGRNARYGAKGDIAKVRAALTASKDLNNLVHSLGLSGEKADAFKASLANIITGGLAEEGDGKATVKPGDNSGNETTVTTQEPPNGQYEIEKDGKKYHWGKSKSGKWGYFPNK